MSIETVAAEIRRLDAISKRVLEAPCREAQVMEQELIDKVEALGSVICGLEPTTARETLALAIVLRAEIDTRVGPEEGRELLLRMVEALILGLERIAGERAESVLPHFASLPTLDFDARVAKARAAGVAEAA
ncbi:MAG: hypothetical protein AB7O44_29255 [Hyphomicrobiaceae bacterium]